MSSEGDPKPPPRTKRKKPIGPSTPTPAASTPTTTAADNSPDNLYQNTAAVTPPRKTSGYENISSSSLGASAAAGGDGGMEDTPEKRKPVPRTRNSLRNRGRGGVGRSNEDLTAMNQSPPLIEQDEHLLGSLGVSGGSSSREDSISPDLRNNTPSPRPKPRGKRGFADNSDIASSPGAPPLPPAKPHTSSSPSRRGAPPGPPPKIPKTVISDSSLASSTTAGKKKPIPPLPPRESTPENHLNSSGGGGFKRSASGNQDRTEVLDVSSGKTLPLEFVEKELESVGEADTSKSSSILDTIMSLVGDDVLEDVDNSENSHTTSTPVKALPTIHNRSLDYGDEAPPIPAHTMASMELVEQGEPAVGRRGGGNKSPMIQDPLSSTYDVVGAVTESVYEQPEPPKLSVPSFGQKSSSFHGSHAGRDPLPPPLPPANKPMQMDSSSTASSIVTMARNTSDTHVNGGTSHTSKPKKGLFGFGRKDKKKDKDKEEISGPLIIGGGAGIVKSPSINTMSSSTSSSHSPMHDRANNKYSFPGDLGYGIRIKKPAGPRREPQHWANSLTLPIANKA